MSDKYTGTNREEELEQIVDRRVLLGSLALEDERPRSSGQLVGPPDDAESRFDEVDEWFARAALGRMCDDEAAPSCELLGAATLRRAGFDGHLEARRSVLAERKGPGPDACPEEVQR